MILSKKIRLKPTKEQEQLFWKCAGTARWAYNYFLSENERLYKEYLTNGKTGQKYISGNKLRKYINNTLKKTTHKWLSEVGSNVMKQAVKDAEKAYQNWFKGISGKPKYKSKRRSKPSFYVNYENLTRKNGGFRGEKLGLVKTSRPLPKLPKGKHYSDPRIFYDGKYWYLSVGYEVNNPKPELTNESIGINLGIKHLAICSNGKTYKNINKTATMRKLNKRLRREQRKLSRMLKNNISGYTSNRKPIYSIDLQFCSNIQKQKQKIKLIHRRIKNIRHNHLHQTTTEIVKTKPSRIVMEDLNMTEMMKNKHLAKSIKEQCFYKFRRQIEYKCESYGIEFVLADRFYPSSKLCSNCGHKKTDLKLSDRTYICPHCETVIDRDYNTSINLANYSA